MKKTYSTPAIDVKKFDVADIITVSGGAVHTPTTAATITKDATGKGSVEILAKW